MYRPERFNASIATNLPTPQKVPSHVFPFGPESVVMEFKSEVMKQT
jgi:hypothetical protein